MVLADFLTTATIDTVVNIEFNREIIDSFSVKDFFYTRKKINYLSRYNRPIKSVYFNNEKNVTVEIKKRQIEAEKKELICYKDGSFTLDNKPFENIIELTNYLSWN